MDFLPNITYVNLHIFLFFQSRNSNVKSIEIQRVKLMLTTDLHFNVVLLTLKCENWIIIKLQRYHTFELLVLN